MVFARYSQNHHSGRSVSKMKKSKPLLISCLVVAAAVFLVALLNYRRDHPLAKPIGLELVDDYTHENSINRGVRVLIYSKKDVDHDLYDFICGKASAMYTDPNFNDGFETNRKQNLKAVRSEYSHGEQRAFEIRSKDDFAVIYVIEYGDYVAVVLIQARI